MKQAKRKIKILYVNEIDLMGRRFNGYDMQLFLNQNDFDAKQMVIDKLSDDENVVPIVKTYGVKFLQERVFNFEEKNSLQSVIYPFGELLFESPEFKEADIVHYHLIFNHVMSLYSFEKMAKTKPSVWTLHDPWALTGHCVHPVDCKGWLTGCHNCPYLDRYAPLKEDNSSQIWKIKKDIYSKINPEIVVASQWMLNLVKQSPLTSHFNNIHLIPFGIDTNLFKRKENRMKIREELGIGDENFVIMFRQSIIEWKGLSYIEGMLKDLKISKPVTLLTVGQKGLLDSFKDKYQIVEYEWVNDNDFMVDLYSSADLFLMPSIAESFGMMAIEAMACSLPVIVFEGTALPSVTFAPQCGISIMKTDKKKFVETVIRLINSPQECKKRGSLGRELAEKNYKVEIYYEKMINLYKEVSKRSQNNI